MKIKICGLKEIENIKDITALSIDYVGFIFYSLSKRYVGKDFKMPTISSTIKKVGVFVNEPVNDLLNIAQQYQLDVIQLHGTESNEYCNIIRANGYKIIKAISVRDVLNRNELLSYSESVDFFLFDTYTPEYGGSGRVFPWACLASYDLNIPFFISGGIGLEQVQDLKDFRHPSFYGIDANSRLETAPGLKNIALTQNFINQLKYE